MASQPANTLIEVQYTVRSYQDSKLHRAVLDWHMMGKKMSVPSKEVLVDETRDSAVDVLTTALLEGRDSGLPVVRHAVAAVTPADAVADATFKTNLAFPKRIGRDLFFHKTSAGKTADLHAQLRAV